MSPQPNTIERIQGFAKNTPQHPAVEFENETLTYETLNRQANQLAHYLKSLGVSSESTVALCVKRSLDLPLSMLAILKSGATYIPLDPEYPKARLTDRIRETKTKIIITHESFMDYFGSCGAEVIVLEKHNDRITKKSSKNLPLPAFNHVAYIMHTSGSTGLPKGVEIEHTTLAERFVLSPYHLLMNQDDRLAGITSVSWNPSIYENIYTLANGATLVLCSTETTRDPRLLQNFIETKKITFMRAVPSLWRGLIDTNWSGKADLTIVSHGEKLDSSLMELLRHRGKAVYNTYGSTEATVFSLLPITSSKNNQMMILDDELKPVKSGEIGEIYFSGPVIARGYYNDPELTASKFILDPDGSNRFYKTGDLARKLRDGSIEFLGRADDQVKIRGQRIELAEVEAAIAKYPKIKSVVVHACEDHSGSTRLVGYLIPLDSLEISELRAYLNDTIPQAMIPSVFVILDQFPLNNNGKVDRKALPLPSRERPDLGITFVGPETETQKTLVRIFAHVLNYEQIGINDHFFALGGHSLMAALVCSRIKDEFELDFSLECFFHLPTVLALSGEIDRRKKQGERNALSNIEIIAEREKVPLSFAQERLWFMHKLSGNSSDYNLPTANRLVGNLDQNALQSSISLILKRHEALRTSFHMDKDGKPFQTVESATELDLTPLDFAYLSVEKREQAVRDWIANDAKVPFDLSKSPLIRAKLFRLDTNDHVLYVNIHHISSDGWSKAVFKRELVDAYLAFSENRTPALKALPVQYLDFAAWQHSHLTQTEVQRQIQYWLQELSGLEALNMPIDRPRPKILTQRGAQETLTIAPDILKRLNAIAMEQNASLYMVLLAAFNLLLHRYSGQNDIAIGSPIAGRVRPETEGLIGFFVNTLVMRLKIDPKKTFLDLLKNARTKSLNAYSNQDLPFERLVSEINPERDLSRYPLTQTVFALQNTPYDGERWAGLKSENFNFQTESTRFDLELHAWERDEGLRCHLIYNTDLFDQWRMSQLLGHFKSVLESVSQNLEIPLGDIQLLSNAERKKILVDWNQTTADYPKDQCIHHLVEKKAEQFPNQLAVSSVDCRLSFIELNQKANQLAHYLIKRGVHPENRVAICLPRSAEIIVTMLGVMKAGGTYVPLDPDYPEKRLEFMLSDSKASILLTQAELDSHRDEIAEESKLNPTVAINPEHLAYIIYTSGSTGQPNGVMAPHRGLVNLINYYQNTFNITENDRSIFISSPSFDASALEVWGNLSAGASLFIPKQDTRMILSKLIPWIDENKLSICFLPTSFMEQIFELIPPSSLRILFTGGDRLRVYPPRNFIKVVNLYGPTENSVVSTAAIYDSGKSRNSFFPPIGKPISNHQAYILDPEMKPVPVGVAGELVMGGSGITKAYVNRPELNLKKFVPNPFADDFGSEKLYRTGDLARYLTDGQIEFLGRIDHQVKIRGYRIEPGETSKVILGYPGIKDAYTLVREDVPGDQKLVSYIVVDPQVSAPDLESKHVDQWQNLYEREYTSKSEVGTEFNITGWNSSFTGGAIPDQAMREWVDCTVSRIQEFEPRRIFEIGCGTGLLLFPLAQSAHKYTAVDISRNAIEGIRGTVLQSESLRNKVLLKHGPAHELSWMPSDFQADTIIINSVIQYFPSEAYLQNVIEDVTKKVCSGGHIFIGDVRNFDLLHAFHLEVELHRSSDEDVTANLKQRVEARAIMDKELLLSPSFFHALQTKIPRISGVEIRPKRGRFKTEMNMFRYDVTLYVDEPAQHIKPSFHDFENLGATVENLEVILEHANTPIVIRNIKDRRNAGTLNALQHLHESVGQERIGNFRNRHSEQLGTDLENLHEFATRKDLQLELRLSHDSREIEALLIPRTSKKCRYDWKTPLTHHKAVFGNDPLRHGRIASIRPQIREYLRKKLPEYMIPSTFVFLENLPFTSNGKINRKALPAPASERPELLESYVAPRNKIEQSLAEIFAKILGVDLVGVQDNFFELGGHSLLAVQLVSQIEEKLGVEIPLTTLFEGPTAAQLGTHVQLKPSSTPDFLEDEKDPNRVPLTAMDLNFHYSRIFLKSSDHSWYQVMELEVAQLDRRKLETAILYAVNKHPIARGKISSVSALGKKVFWDVKQHLEKAPLSIHLIKNEDELNSVRQKLINSPFSIDEAPFARFVLVSGVQSDRLFLRYNHGAMDASGLQCLLNSMMSHYLGQKDPVKKVLPYSNTELFKHYGHKPKAMILSSGINLNIFRVREIFPAKIHASGGIATDRGCSALEVEFSIDETTTLTATAKEMKTTLDRLFIVGILNGAKIWNQKFTPSMGRIEAYWAVNLRPPKAFDSIVANQFGWARIRSPDSEKSAKWKKEILDPGSDFLIRGALDWIQSVISFHHLPMPSFLRRFLISVANLGMPSMFISNTLTVSVNEVEKNPLAEAFGLVRMQNHSRFGSTDRPVMVIGRNGGKIRLRMIYPKFQFNKEGALQFLETCKNATMEVKKQA